MALFLDGFAIAGPTAGNPFTIEYEPNEPINGIVAMVSDTNTSGQPGMFGITVDGIPMVEVDQSPFVGDQGSEDCVFQVFFLGSGIPADVFPTGELAYVFDMDDTSSGASSVRIFHIVSDAGNDTAILGTGTSSQASAANPSMAMGPTTVPTMTFGMLCSGHDANSSVAAGSGDWQDSEQDQGTRITSWLRPSGGSEFPASDPDTIDLVWTAAAEEAHIFGVMVYELGAAEAGSTTGAPGSNRVERLDIGWRGTPHRASKLER